MSPRPGRVALFFVGFIGGIAAPTVAALVLGFTGPPPYLLDEARLAGAWDRPRSFPDGSTVAVTAHAGEGAARDAVEGVVRAIPGRVSIEKTLDVWRTRDRASGRAGIVLPVGNRVVHVEAADRAAVDARLGALPFVVENPRRNVVIVLFTRHLGATLAGLGAWVVALAIFFVVGSAWAARIDPPAGAQPLSLDALRERLAALDGLDLPLAVREAGPGRLTVEWRIADARWGSLLSAGGVRRTLRMHLRLDGARRRVRATEEWRAVTWSGGVGRFTWSFSWSRGITFFALRGGATAGVRFAEGRWRIDRDHTWRGDEVELKSPLVEAVLDGGWSWAPSVL